MGFGSGLKSASQVSSAWRSRLRRALSSFRLPDFYRIGRLFPFWSSLLRSFRHDAQLVALVEENHAV
jgi:hypothetical protein